ncbi:MAG: hypothetical protein U9R17_12485, partial [Thermodesulfobacteriota bacterium]|nr:hypothetical protein [Thermodesulfobacteriota bacterium]
FSILSDTQFNSFAVIPKESSIVEYIAICIALISFRTRLPCFVEQNRFAESFHTPTYSLYLSFS